VTSQQQGPEPTLLYILGLKPEKVGGMELFCRALAQRLLSLRWRVVFCCEASPSDAVRQALDFPNIAWEVIPVQAGFSARRALECAQLVRKYKPSVVIYAFNGVLRPYPWISRLLGVDRIFYNDHTSRELPSGRRSVVKRALGRMITLPLSGSICVSDYTRRCELAEGFIAPERIETVYNGIDLGRVASAAGRGRSFRERFAIPPEKKVVLQVCWMVPVKGVDKLLEAARVVIDRVPEAHFVLAGEGPNRPAYEALSRELGIANSVTWTGMVKNPISEGLFDAAELCCLFSQWQEACPLAVLEAMTSGVPVISSNSGGLPELVADGRTGFVVDKDDITGLAQKIVLLLEDSELRTQFGANARRWVADRFDLNRTVDAYVERLTGAPARHAAVQQEVAL